MKISLKISVAGLLLACVVFSAKAQYSGILSANNIEAGFTANGSLFQSPYNFGEFKIKGDSGKTAIFAGALWLGYHDSNLDLKRIAAQTHYMHSNLGSASIHYTDFTPGPVRTANLVGSGYYQKYDRVWKVSRSQIEYHKAHYHESSYKMPEVIKNWPGNGDVALGEAEILAGFSDYNLNRVYEPELGEHPNIRGDEAIFIMFNDKYRYDPLSSNLKIHHLGAEVHLMVYAYDAPGDTALHNSLFLHYRIFNRSTVKMDALNVAHWFDFDLGNHLDDLIGTDSAKHLLYVYNGDTDDEGPAGFGLFPPAIGVIDLSNTVVGAGYYAQGASFSGPQAMTTPEIPAEFFNFMQQRWRNGSPLFLENPSGFGSTLNGDGFIASGSGTKTRWAYNDNENWAESPSNAADKMSLVSRQSTSLSPGEDMCLDLAITYARDRSNPDLMSSLVKLKAYDSHIKQFFASKAFSCMGTEIGLNESRSFVKLHVYPNPTTDLIRIESITNISSVLIYNSTGNLVHEARHLDTKHFEADLRAMGLSTGIYLLHVSSAQAEVAVKKVMLR